MNGGGDNFARVLQLNKSNGNQNWVSDFTGINNTLYRGIKAGGDGTVFVSALTYNNTGNLDLGIQQIDTSGTELWWAAYNGCGETTDHAAGLHVTNDNQGVLTGHNIQAVTLKYAPLVDPAAEFSVSNDTTCVGTPVTFTDGSTGSTLSYSWNFGAGASIDSIMGIGPHDVSYSTAGTKTITLTVTNGLGDSTMTQTIEVLPLPALSTSGDTVICYGDSVQVQAFGAGTFDWNLGLGAGSTHMLSPLVDTDYAVMLTDSFGCQSFDTITISVLELPVVNTGADTAICSGNGLWIQATGAGIFEWDNGLGSGSGHLVYPTVTTDYGVTLTDSLGCQNFDTINVWVNDLPTVGAGTDTSICLGESTMLSGSGSGTLTWSHGLGNVLNPNVSPLSSTDYILNVVDGNGCMNSDTVRVNIFNLPVTDAGVDQEICNGDSTAISATGGQVYTWDGLGAGQTHTVAPSTNTSYVVAVTDTNTCSSTDTVTITVNPSYLIQETVSVCPGSDHTFPDGTIWSNITFPIVYTSSFATSASCDSIIETSIALLDCSCGNPSIFNVTDIGTTEATMRWEAKANAISYELKFRKVGNSSWAYRTISAPDTFIAETGLLPFTNYEYKVKTVCDQNSPAAYSGFQYFTTIGFTCNNPTEHSVSNIGPNGATFHWNPEPNATKYKLKIRKVGTTTWSYHTIWAPDTFKVRTGLEASSDYEYKVKTVCAVNSPSGYGPFQYMTTLDPPCANPTVTMTGVNSTQTSATWNPVANANKYVLKYRPTGESTWKYRAIYAPASSKLLSNLIPDTQYEYKIRTECATANEPNSPLAYFQTLSCEIPDGRTVTNVVPNSATLKWNTVEGAVTYKARYRIHNTSTWSYRNVAAPDTTADISNLESGTLYQWVIKSFCSPSSNFSPYSGNNLFGTATSAEGGGFSRLAEEADEVNLGITIYPNPTSGLLTIELGDVSDATISVRNIHSQLVLRRSIQDKRNTQIELFGNTGLYTVEVMTAKGESEVFKVLKQ